MSVSEIPVNTIKKLPVLLGEIDVLKTVQLLPGVQSGNEGTSGLYVRGGGPDQNLILLDGVPVYNANHLFGFFSVFNADAINTVTLIKGGFPARYGGRLSSVLDIRMKEGNMKKIKGAASIGIIASRLTVEGPIIKDKTSFIISGRRTYIDFLSQPIIRSVARMEGVENLSLGYYFYDLNGKINHKFSDKSRLYLSAYMGNDKAYMKMKEEDSGYEYLVNAKLRWGNITTALRWNYILSNKLFSNTTLTFSRYNFLVGMGMEENDTYYDTYYNYNYEYLSGIDDLGGKIDFDYLPSPNHYVRFGVGEIYHTFKPGVNTFSASSGGDQNFEASFGNRNIYASELSAYAEDDIRIGALIKTNIGLHGSAFILKNKTYKSLQPRASLRFLITEDWSIKAAYSQMTQYVHLLSNSNIGLPTDLWLPVTDTVRPLKSTQYAAGIFHQLNDDISISLEGFYKTMDNLIEYKEGASFFMLEGSWEDKIEIGKGWSYGIELLLEKKLGKLTGWLGYTLSWSERQFDNISFGEPYPYKYDRRHDIGIALTYKYNEKIDAGLVWVYGTGNAVTLAHEKYASAFSTNMDYWYGDNMIEYYDKRNNYRMPSYHRLDLSINFNKKLKWGERTLSVGVYNAYNRKNPFFIMFEERRGGEQLVQYSLFPIIPSISYNVTF